MIVRDSGRATVVLAVGTTIAGSMPVFLIGALFVALQADIHAPTWVLGLAVAAFWVAAAVVSILSGRLISKIGSRRATIISVSVAVASLLGSAFIMPNWGWLVFWGILGGGANGLGHPASNHLLSLRVAPTRIATALGIKQGSVPFAAFIAGLMVPVLALTVGWQWGFVSGALMALLLLLAFFRWGPRRVPGRIRPPHVRLEPDLARYLLLIASFSTLGAAAAGATASFAVIAGISRGLDAGIAGILLSVGSLLGASCRVIAGRIADRTKGKYALPMTGGMAAIGGLGVLLMAIDTPATFAIGLTLALAIGWGWTGLTHFVVSRAAGPATPSATGIVQTGSYLGSAAGPLLFGLAFAFTESTTIWLVIAALFFVAATIAFVLSRREAPPVPVR